MFQVNPLLEDSHEKIKPNFLREIKVNKRAMMALGRSPEHHWDQIISKSVHRFRRRSPLKLFSIYSPGGHFVQQSGTFLYNYFKIHALAKEEKSFEGFSVFSSGGHLVQWCRTV